MTSNWATHIATHAGDATQAADAAAITAAGRDPTADPFSRSQVYVAAGMVAVQLAVSPDEGLDRLRAYTYAQGRSIAAVATDIIERRLSLRDQRDPAKDQ